MLAITFTCFTVVLAVIPTIVLFIQQDEDFYEFFGMTVLLTIMSVIFWLPINVIRKTPQGMTTDLLVQIDQGYIMRSGFGGTQVQRKPLSKVKKVVDAGDWYYVVFKGGSINSAFVCQKNLLTKGTLDEFEKLFEGKLVRKYGY